MKLSVIIVNYNVKYFLEQCLLSVTESNIDFDIEIIVVDNNSTDGSVDYLIPKFPTVKFIANKNNPGFAKANNQAIKISTGDQILLLNPDTLVGENTLKNVFHFLSQTSDAGAAGVKMINGSGLFLPESKRGFPTPWVSFCKAFSLNKVFPKSPFFGKYHLRYLDENKMHKVEILSGAFIMIKRDVLDKTGLLDESFFMYGEDIDLSYRIIKAGYNNYYLPDKIIHYKGESTKKHEMRYVKIFYKAMYIFFKKYYPNSSRIYSFFIVSGIYTRASLEAVSRFMRKIFRIKKKPKRYETILFDHSVKSYEEMIETMDEKGNKNVEYVIYSPKSGMTIGAHFAEKRG